MSIWNKPNVEVATCCIKENTHTSVKSCLLTHALTHVYIAIHIRTCVHIYQNNAFCNSSLVMYVHMYISIIATVYTQDNNIINGFSAYYTSFRLISELIHMYVGSYACRYISMSIHTHI